MVSRLGFGFVSGVSPSKKELAAFVISWPFA